MRTRHLKNVTFIQCQQISLLEKVYFLKAITCEVEVAASKYAFGISN